MAVWNGGFSGVGFYRDEFRKWLRSQPKPPYHRIVNHMTDAPYTKASVPGSQRIRNLGNYYKNDLGWSGGPDFFSLGDGKIYLGSPLGKSIGCKGWNGNSFHIEVEGKYNGTTHDYRTGSGFENWKVSAWAQAEILEWMGWKADGDRIKLHKEGNTTHKACPGVVPKEWIIQQIAGAWREAPASSAEATGSKSGGSIPPARSTLKKGMTGGDVTVLQILLNHHGANPKLLTDGDFGPVTLKTVMAFQTAKGLDTDGIVGKATWAALGPYPPPAGNVASPKPAPEPVKPTVPVIPLPVKAYPPGQAKWSETWLLPMMKKVEGLRLLAYFDKPGWAIGYGHNSTSGVPPIPYEGMTLINEATAEEILRGDLNECLRYINTWVKVPLEPHHVDALCMNIFQQGPTQFRKRLLDTINAGDHGKVAELIENMAHANPGVMRRRRLEAARYRGEAPMKW